MAAAVPALRTETRDADTARSSRADSGRAHQRLGVRDDLLDEVVAAFQMTEQGEIPTHGASDINATASSNVQHASTPTMPCARNTSS